MDVGEAEVATGEAVGELFVVEAHEMEDGGPHVVDGARVLGGVVAEVVGGAVDVPAFDTTAGHPDGEAVGVVVATITALSEGCAAEFTSPDDEGGVEEAA